jgi:hypothetical protein
VNWYNILKHDNGPLTKRGETHLLREVAKSRARVIFGARRSHVHHRRGAALAWGNCGRLTLKARVTVRRECTGNRRLHEYAQMQQQAKHVLSINVVCCIASLLACTTSRACARAVRGLQPVSNMKRSMSPSVSDEIA